MQIDTGITLSVYLANKKSVIEIYKMTHNIVYKKYFISYVYFTESYI